MDIVVLGIDLGKNSCSLAGLDASGQVILRRRMRRSSVESFVEGLGRCIVAMEACCRASSGARGLLARAHKNVVVGALANKLARIAWAVLARGRTY
jgi:transposase